MNELVLRIIFTTRKQIIAVIYHLVTEVLLACAAFARFIFFLLFYWKLQQNSNAESTCVTLNFGKTKGACDPSFENSTFSRSPFLKDAGISRLV